MGILTVMCYEQAGLFEYFSAAGSQAGCSFVKALYCISFLCQSLFSCGGAVSNDDPPGFLQVAWRRAPPRALWPSPPTFARPRLCRRSSHSPPCAFEARVFPPSPSPLSSVVLLSSLPSSTLSVHPSVHTSFPLRIPSSLLPLSHCPGQRRVRQAFPVQAAGPDHTLRGDFCYCCQ